MKTMVLTSVAGLVPAVSSGLEFYGVRAPTWPMSAGCDGDDPQAPEGLFHVSFPVGGLLGMRIQTSAVPVFLCHSA